ncbi:MAG: DUF3574 domain-containing protein [Chloroflexota bacterium]|nr:DUF3574 domain-containing protein [Chloroflexota bacterium]
MHTETPFRHTSYSRSAVPGIVALAIAILMSGTMFSAASAQDVATPVVEATPEGVANMCEATSPGVGAEPWIRTELYFGTTLPDGSEMTADQWADFLDAEITPRFPDGLTVLEGYGQFLNSEGIIAGETSIVLIIFHPGEFVDESSVSIEEIRDAYETAFEQESVLRVDSEPVCVSF